MVLDLKGLRIEPAREEAWRLHLAVAAVLARLGSLWSQRDGYSAVNTATHDIELSQLTSLMRLRALPD